MRWFGYVFRSVSQFRFLLLPVLIQLTVLERVIRTHSIDLRMALFIIGSIHRRRCWDIKYRLEWSVIILSLVMYLAVARSHFSFFLNFPRRRGWSCRKFEPIMSITRIKWRQINSIFTLTQISGIFYSRLISNDWCCLLLRNFFLGVLDKHVRLRLLALSNWLTVWTSII